MVIGTGYALLSTEVSQKCVQTLMGLSPRYKQKFGILLYSHFIQTGMHNGNGSFAFIHNLGAWHTADCCMKHVQ